MPPALLFGGLGLFSAQQAQAQADTVLVSNFAQTIDPGPDGNSLRQVALREDSFATGFTTGSAPGYIISSIDARLRLVPDNNVYKRSGLKAELWSSNANGTPKSKIVSLKAPPDTRSPTLGPVVQTNRTHIVTFTAPTGTRLARNTNYHLVIYRTDGVFDDAIVTESTSEDAGAASGWSIANAYNFILDTRPPSGAWKTFPSNRTGFMRIKGRAVVDITDLSMTTGGNAVPLSPVFDPSTANYTATVPIDATNVSVKPTWNGTATVYARAGAVFLGRPMTFRSSGRPRTINLRPGGATKVEVAVSSADVEKAYEIIILRDSGEPKNLGVTPGSPGTRELDLSWTAPAGAVTGYDVQYTAALADTVADDAAVQTGGSASAADGWVAVSRSGTTPSQSITGLFEDTEYRVRVRAKYSGFDSAWVFGKGRTLVTLKWPGPATSIEEGDSRQFRLNAGDVGNAVSGTLTYAAGASNPASLSDDLTPGYATTFSVPANDSNPPTIRVASSVNDTVNEEHETYTITLNAGAGYVVGSPSRITVTITDNDPPTAPSGLSLSAGSGGLSASWTKPVGPVTGYKLRHKETAATDQVATTPGDPSTGWVTSTITGTSAEITGLTNDTGYDVQVRATDGQTGTGNGYGAWSASQSDTPMEGLGGLTGLFLAIEEEAVDLSPVFDADTTSYTATVPAAATSVDVTPTWVGSATVFATGTTIDRRRPLPFSTSGTAKTVNLATSGATTVNVFIIPDGGDQQGYTVTITREAGGAPTDLGVTAGNTKLDLAWTAPAGTLTGYDVQYTSAPTTGDGAVTNDAAVQTGDGATAADGWVAVDRGTEADPPATEQEITSLTNGQLYRVRVRAKSSEGDSDWVFDTGTPQETAPSAPRDLLVVPDHLQLGLIWTKPSSGTVTGYDVEYTSAEENDVANGAAVQTGTAADGWVAVDRGTEENPPDTVQEITGLTGNREYRVRVRAKNAAGVSEWVFDTGTPSLPGPTGLGVTPGDEQLALTWTAPSSGTVTGYDVEYTSADGDTVADEATASGTDPAAAWVAVDRSALTDATAAAQTIADLTNGQLYRVRVRATTDAGDTVWVYDSGTPQGGIPVPEDLEIVPGDTVLAVTWTAPAGTLTGYDVQYTSAPESGDGSVADDAAVQTGDTASPADGWVAVDRDTESAPPVTFQEISGLTNGQLYRVRVRAKTSEGDSDWVVDTGTPEGSPAEPSDLEVTERDGQLDVSWDDPPSGTVVTGYDVQYTSADVGTVGDNDESDGTDDPANDWVAVDRGTEADPPETSQTIEGLTNGRKYRVRVRAKTSEEIGSWTYFGTGTPSSTRGGGGGGGGGGGEGTPDLTVAPPVLTIVTIAAVEEEVTEGGAARFTVSATPVPRAGAPLSVSVAVSDSGDFAANGQTGPRTVVVGESGSASFSVSTEDDAFYEEDGILTVAVEQGSGYTPHASSNSAAVTVRDNDRPVVTIEAMEEEVIEGGEARFRIRATPAPAPGTSLSVRVRVSQRGDVAASGQIGIRTVLIDDSGTAVFSVSTEDYAAREGDGTLTVVVEEGSGYTTHASENAATVTVRDNDLAPPTAEQKGWLLRFGRTVSQQVVDALQQRFSSSNTQAGLEITLAGESLSGATPLEENHVLLSRLLGFEKVSSQELAQGSSFNFSADSAGPRLSFWGSGALSSFNGSEDTFNLTGDVTTALLGAEWSSERWRAGAALSHSRGSGSYQGGRGDGDISGALTGLFPYGRYALTPRLGIWATAGYGWGSLSHNPDGYALEYNPAATMTMGALGMEGLLLEGGSDGITLTTTADLLMLKTSSQEVEGLPASDGNLSRFRLGLEATRPFLLRNGSSLSPSLELGIRQDRGDAETGFGMDLGASLTWSAPEHGVSAVVKGRTLLSHGAEHFQEKGLALSFSWQPTPSERGVSLSLSHAVGGAAEGGMASLLNPTAIEVLDAASSDGERFEARLAYGFPFYNDRLTITPSVAAALSPSSRSYSLLWSLAPYAEQLLEEPWELSLEGERQEHSSSSSPVDHSLRLLFSLPL